MEKAPTFRKFITNPITSSSERRFQNLQKLLQSVCLRRTRQLLNLPEPIPRTRRLDLSTSEQVEYDKLKQQCREEIDMVVSGRRKSKLNSAMLESLLKLRLFCNNGRTDAVLHTRPTGLPIDPDEALSYLQQHDENICAYCSVTIYSISDAVETDGGTFMPSCCHLVCRNCMPYHRGQVQSCSICAAGSESTVWTMPSLPPDNAGISSTRPVENKAPLRTGQYPSKLLVLLSDLRQDPNNKR